MAKISGFKLYAVDLPFRKSFKHSAAERTTSASVFLQCVIDSGTIGYGECLPREYVTGESRDPVFERLHSEILPRLLGKSFQTMQEVEDFLSKCDGKSPGWIDEGTPQSAAWCAVDLALLDAFGRQFETKPLSKERLESAPLLRYSGALSSEKGLALIKSALKQRLFGIREIKLKVSAIEDAVIVGNLRRLLGKKINLRVDANMAWDVATALEAAKRMAAYGVESFEQPLAADDFDGLSRLVRESGVGIMVDESFSDQDSLNRLVAERACTGVNVRISKCGGLVASVKRAREALKAGLDVQLGCQVGESSLLSAAQLLFAKCVHPVKFFEGCFGLHLLREDPVLPVLQFGRGGRPPRLPDGPGLGVGMDENVLERWTIRREEVK